MIGKRTALSRIFSFFRDSTRECSVCRRTSSIITAWLSTTTTGTGESSVGFYDGLLETVLHLTLPGRPYCAIGRPRADGLRIF